MKTHNEVAQWATAVYIMRHSMYATMTGEEVGVTKDWSSRKLDVLADWPRTLISS